MKSNTRNLLKVLTIIIIASLLFYYSNYSLLKMVALFSYIILAKYISNLSCGFINPGDRLYSGRYFIGGFFFILLLNGFFQIMDWETGENNIDFNPVVIGFNFIFAVLLGVWNTRKFSNLKKEIKIELIAEETLILEGSAYLETRNTSEKGLLVLTDKNLYFKTSNPDILLSFKLENLKTNFHKYLGIPDGLLIENNSQLIVCFPALWQSKIHALQRTG